MKTSRGSSQGVLGVSVLVLALWSSFGLAQGFKQIHVCGADDAAPNTMISNSGDGFLYGTSHGGNEFGSVWKMDTSGNVTILHMFAGGPNDGIGPAAAPYLNSDGLL